MGTGPRTIERMTAAQFAERLPQLRQSGTPAVVTDLFDGTVLGSTADPDRALELLAAVRVSVRTRYVDSHVERVSRYIRGVPMPRNSELPKMSFADYVRQADDKLRIERPRPAAGERLDLPSLVSPTGAAQRRLIVTEEPAPALLLKGLDLSALGVHAVVGDNVNPYASNDPSTAYAMVFIGDRGNASDLHTDGDGRDVLLFQGFGRKRVCLFPNASAPLLHPVAGYATVRLGEMDGAERRAFVEYAQGYDDELRPGETVFMPAFIWHHLDYLELSLSVAFRFAGIDDPLATELIRRVHLDQYTQAIIVGTRDPARAEASRQAAQQVLSTARRRYPSARAKYRAVRATAIRNAPPSVDAHGRHLLRGYVEPEEFLDGGLSGFYSSSPDGPATRHPGWHLRERIRDGIRRRARRIAYWA